MLPSRHQRSIVQTHPATALEWHRRKRLWCSQRHPVHAQDQVRRIFRSQIRRPNRETIGCSRFNSHRLPPDDRPFRRRAIYHEHFSRSRRVIRRWIEVPIHRGGIRFDRINNLRSQVVRGIGVIAGEAILPSSKAPVNDQILGIRWRAVDFAFSRRTRGENLGDFASR